MKQEENEEELNRTYQLGQVVGLERAAGIIMEDAKDCFTRRDTKADYLRELALKLIAIADSEHPRKKDK